MTMAGTGINLRVVLIIAAIFALYVGSSRANAETSDHTSRKQSFKAALQVDLIRRDSPLSPFLDGRNLSNAQRLRRAIERSHHRLRRIESFFAGSAGFGHSMSYYSPLNGDEQEFLMQLAIGSPVPLNMNFIADTGSDLIWTQCQPCGSSCFAQSDPMYSPANSSSYMNISCSSNFCLDVSGLCDTQKNCAYFYEYGDYSSTSGILGYETFSLITTLGSGELAPLPHLAFGCGSRQSGDFSDSTGIVGLGRGPLSFVSQIKSSINNTFSYCLGSIYNSSQTSPLIFGNDGLASSGSRVSVTPLIHNHFYPTFYYLSLSRISVAGKSVSIPVGTFNINGSDGRGGLFIDSGTTITYLQDAAYRPFLAAIRSSINGGQTVNGSTGLDLCYKATPALRLPTIIFHFAGNAPYVLPANNSFVFSVEGTDDTVCLAFASAGPTGSTAVFGNVQQQNFHITYDLQRNRLYFAQQQNCASM